MYQNVRGLRTKIYQLRNFMAVTDFDVIIFVETSLYPGIANDEYKNKYNNVFRSDRLDRDGGGVLISTRRCLRGRLFNCSKNISYILFVEGALSNKIIIFGAVYIPPSSPLACYESFLTRSKHCIP